MRRQIAGRMEQSARRKFPEWLLRAHTEKVTEGALGKGTLAWMLGVDQGEIEDGHSVSGREPDHEPDLEAFFG